MSSRFHEKHAEILRWPWKLFCAKWARLIELAAKEQDEMHKREDERALERLKQTHNERWHGGGNGG